MTRPTAEKLFPLEVVTRLAVEHGLDSRHVPALEAALWGALGAYEGGDASVPEPGGRPPEKRDVEAAASTAKKLLASLNTPGMLERIASSQVSAQDNEIAYEQWATAWHDLRGHRDAVQALATTLVSAVAAKLPSKRAEDWVLERAARELLEVWKAVKTKNPPLSLYDASGRPTKPSGVVKFVHAGLKVIDPKLTIVAVFNVLKKTKKRPPR